MALNTKQKILMAKALSRGLVAVRGVVGRGATVVARRRAVLWELDLREGIDLALYLGVYERQTWHAIESLLPEGGVALDVGANIGAHTLPMAHRLGPAGRVVAFEPTDFAFAKLVRNAALNPGLAERIVFQQVILVGDSSAAGPPAIHSSWPLASAHDDLHPVFQGRPMSTKGAVATTLDECVEGLALGRMDLIKIDVDGHEMEVLRGAQSVLREYRPLMVMEFAPYLHSDFDALLDLLTGLGYRAETRGTGKPIPLNARAVRALCPDGGGVDLVLRHFGGTAG